MGNQPTARHRRIPTSTLRRTSNTQPVHHTTHNRIRLLALLTFPYFPLFLCQILREIRTHSDIRRVRWDYKNSALTKVVVVTMRIWVIRTELPVNPQGPCVIDLSSRSHTSAHIY